MSTFIGNLGVSGERDMRLKDLEATFLQILDDKTYQMYVSLAEAHGVQFLCPKCFAANDGKVGTHYVICWFRNRGVPDDLTPKPGRWTPSGTDIDDLTFVPGEPPMAVSILLTSGCGWHGYVSNGDAT
jgi:hypothetical protein